MQSEENKLDKYLRDVEQELQPKRTRQKSGTSRKKSKRITSFRRWAASAAMDLFRMYLPVMLLVLSAGICAIIEPRYALYFLYVAGFLGFIALIYSTYDYYRFQTWQKGLNFELEGWNSSLKSRSPKFWDMNGEHWIATRITIVMREPVNKRHQKVLEVFLRRLK
jgi:hypothetical protein